MTTPKSRRPEPRLGRRQNPELDDAILDATRELLFERGYDSFGTRDVADRAGTGSGAIYRRWPNKEALVAEAITTGPDPAPEPTDDPSADLADLIRDRAALAIRHPDLVPGLVTAMRTSPDINQAMQQRHTIEPYREILSRLLGPNHPHVDLLAEVAPALIVHRTIFNSPNIDLDPDHLSTQLASLIAALAATTD